MNMTPKPSCVQAETVTNANTNCFVNLVVMFEIGPKFYSQCLEVFRSVQ